MDDWSLNALASHVSRNDLFSLCLVNKKFNKIFTLHLYKQIWLLNNGTQKLQLLDQLSQEQHLQYAHSLRVHFPLYPRNETQGGTFPDALGKMNNLRSLSLLGQIATPLDMKYEGVVLSPIRFGGLGFLGTLRHLEELTIVECLQEGPFDSRWKWFSGCLLTNLHKLILLNIGKICGPGDLRDIQEIILASPQLEHLALSAQRFVIRYYQGFDDICKFCGDERVKRGGNKLRLKTLHLGFGFLPNIFGTESHTLVADFTDLSALEILEFKNWDFQVQGNDDIPYTIVDTSQFFGMQNLRSVRVKRLSEEIRSIIQRCIEEQPTQKLFELAVEVYYDRRLNHPTLVNLPHQNEPHLSVPLESLGVFNWRKLRVGVPSWTDGATSPFDRSFFERCAEVEELWITVGIENFGNFCAEILPKLRRLKVLILIDQMDEVEPLELHQGARAGMFKFALAMFRRNRQAVESDPRLSALKLFGFTHRGQSEVFACVLAHPFTVDEHSEFEVPLAASAKESRRYRVLKLSAEESLSLFPPEGVCGIA